MHAFPRLSWFLKLIWMVRERKKTERKKKWKKVKKEKKKKDWEEKKIRKKWRKEKKERKKKGQTNKQTEIDEFYKKKKKEKKNKKKKKNIIGEKQEPLHLLPSYSRRHTHAKLIVLTFKTPRKPASENVVCLCRLLNILWNFSNLFLNTGKQCGPWSDCS